LPETIRVKTPAVSSVPSTIEEFGISANFETVMFYFKAVDDIDLDSYAYQLYDNSAGTGTPVASGKNKANVFTISVTNSTDSTPKKYYGRVAVVNSAGTVGTYTSLVSSGDTPLIGNQYISSLTAAKITSGTVSAAEITLSGTNSVIKSSTYDGSWNGSQWTTGDNGWLISGSGQAIFSATQIRGTVAAGSINLNTHNYWLPNSSNPIFKVGNATNFFEWDGTNVRTTGTVITNATVSGGTVGGIASGTTSLYLGLNTFANANTPFYVDTSSRFSLGDKLYFSEGNLTVNGGGTFTGSIQVGDVEIGNDVGPGGGHHGISLSPNNFNNIFLRRASDGVYFFRVNDGGANSITFDSSSGVLNVTGTINASAGTIGGWTIASTTISSGGTTISSSGRITIGLASDTALTLNAGSDMTMFAAPGGNSSIYFYRNGFGSGLWDSKIEQSAAGNFIVYGNDFNGNYYATLLVRSVSYSGAEVRSVDRGVNDDTLGVTRVWTNTTDYNTDIGRSTQMIQFFKKNQSATAVGVGYIRASNATTTPSFVAGSDERLKDDIEIYSTPLIEDIRNINVYDWHDKDDVLKKNKVIGFLAKEFYPKYTTVIDGHPDEMDEDGNEVYMKLSREDLIPHMFGVIKHLTNKVDELERKIENV
jgi:hypothetical protein